MSCQWKTISITWNVLSVTACLFNLVLLAAANFSELQWDLNLGHIFLNFSAILSLVWTVICFVQYINFVVFVVPQLLTLIRKVSHPLGQMLFAFSPRQLSSRSERRAVREILLREDDDVAEKIHEMLRSDTLADFKISQSQSNCWIGSLLGIEFSSFVFFCLGLGLSGQNILITYPRLISLQIADLIFCVMIIHLNSGHRAVVNALFHCIRRVYREAPIRLRMQDGLEQKELTQCPQIGDLDLKRDVCINDQEDIKPTDICSICLETYEDQPVMIYLPCSHVFHTNCIQLVGETFWNFLQRNPDYHRLHPIYTPEGFWHNIRCPLCRQRIVKDL